MPGCKNKIFTILKVGLRRTEYSEYNTWGDKGYLYFGHSTIWALWFWSKLESHFFGFVAFEIVILKFKNL